MHENTTTRIAELNDHFRTTLDATGQLVFTRGIAAWPPATQAALLSKIVTFTAFTPDNDPFREHDFGAVDHMGERIFWKIDYYDPTLTTGSEDPADPSKTIRVLTVMLASEY